MPLFTQNLFHSSHPHSFHSRQVSSHLCRAMPYAPIAFNPTVYQCTSDSSFLSKKWVGVSSQGDNCITLNSLVTCTVFSYAAYLHAARKGSESMSWNTWPHSTTANPFIIPNQVIYHLFSVLFPTCPGIMAPCALCMALAIPPCSGEEGRGGSDLLHVSTSGPVHPLSLAQYLALSKCSS